MKNSSVANKAFKKQQNKFRGLVAALKSRAFVKGRSEPPAAIFRSGLRDLLLDTREVLQPSQYDSFLAWMNHQKQTRLADFANRTIGYEELSGVYTRAPSITLERELLWVTARIKADAIKLNTFRSEAENVENLVFSGKTEDAIEILKSLELTFGTSLWSVQLRIALEHTVGGLEHQKRYVAEVRRVFQRGLLGFIAYHTSVRNEERSTLSKYCDDIKARISNHPYYTSSTKTYTRYQLAGEWPTSQLGFAEILKVEQSHSCIDIYETFISVAQELARREDFVDSRKVLATCLRSLTMIADFRLAKTAQVIDGGRPHATFSKRNTGISDALFIGNVKLATRIARRTLKTSSCIDSWQYIYAGVAFSHATRQRSKYFRCPSDISWLIGRILSQHRNGGDSLAQLEKMVANLRGLPNAAGIIDLLQLLRRSRPDDAWRPWLIGMNSPTIGVEDLPPTTDHSHLSTMGTKDRSVGPTDSAWGRMHGYSIGRHDVCQPAVTLFTAADLLRQEEFLQAVETLTIHHQDRGAEALRSIEASMLLHAYFGLGARQNVIELIADEETRVAANCRLLPLLPALEYYSWPDYKIVSDPLAAPIALHLLWSAKESEATESLLRFATRTTLKNSGVGLPSDYLNLLDKYPKHQLIYFLHEVCVPKILDVARVLKGSREVIEERQAICRVLQNLDPANTDIYQDEMLNLSNQLVMEDGQWIVDGSRVHVDTDALSRWAMKEFSDDYSRYHDLLNLDIGTNQNFDDVLKELSSALPFQHSSTAPDNEADAVLASILTRCGDEFLTNPNFGFDFYLSKRIRHQSFIGLIRGPLEFSRLITTRESELGSYHRNNFWLEQFKSISAEDRDAFNDAFTKFATKFDETLISAKDTKFHLRSKEHPAGILSLNISPQLIAIARTIVLADTTLPEFIYTAILLLWASLEPSLEETRHFVSEELKIKISGGFDELRANARKIAEQDPTFPKFDVEVGRCSTDVQRALDDVVTWFSRTDIEAIKRSFTLDQIVEISIDSALKCLRSFDPDISRQIESDCELTGSALVFISDVMLTALGNARSHSGFKKPKVTVIAKVNTEEGTITIEVLSEVKQQHREKHEEALRDIQQLIEGGNIGRRTRNEGRSGILKLAAVVHQSSKGKIDYGFTDNEQFRLTVTFSLVMQEASQSGVSCEEYAHIIS